MQLFLDAAGQYSDHALMPAGIEQGQAGAGSGVERGQQEFGVVTHAGFDAAPLTVDGVQLLGDVHGAGRIVGGEALDAERHVGQASGGVEARADGETEVEGCGAGRLAAGDAEQRGNAGLHLAAADALQALRDEDAVVAVERHHVRDRAQRHQVEQGGQVGFGFFRVGAAPAQFGAQRQHDVEHHADAGQRLAREIAAGLVRVDDHLCRRQFVARQVVVGNQRGDAAAPEFGHAFDAGDAVVDRDHQVRMARGGELRDFQ